MATVLCIDDNRNILEINKALLESNGYRVLIAPDGPSGIALARTHSLTPSCSISICRAWMVLRSLRC